MNRPRFRHRHINAQPAGMGRGRAEGQSLATAAVAGEEGDRAAAQVRLSRNPLLQRPERKAKAKNA